MKISEIVEAITKEYPEVEKYQDDSFELFNLGLDELRKRDYKEAEKYYKKLILSQPEHHDGFQYLGILKYYNGRVEEAKTLMDKAISLALKFYHDGTLDKEILDEIREEREIVAKGEPVDKIFKILKL